MFIEFSEDCERINIVNRKPLREPRDASQPERLTEFEVKKLKPGKKSAYLNAMLDADTDFENKVSSASTYVS